MTDFTPEQKLVIASHSSNATFHRLANSTVSLFDTIPVYGKYAVSSGTLVEIAGRIFVATARHNIPNNPERRLWILPDRPRKSDEGMLGFVSFGRHPDFDVGFLELTPTALQEYLPNKIPCRLASIRNLNEGRPHKLVTLMGCPEQFIRKHEINGLPAYATKVIGYSKLIREFADWPETPTTDRPADITVDVFLDYPADGNQRLDTGEPITLKTPEGFSGGGLWDQGFEQDELWSIDSICLFAIQSCWHEVERYARAIQIIHWLNLVRSKAPNLQSTLEHAFPELEQMPLLA